MVGHNNISNNDFAEHAICPDCGGAIGLEERCQRCGYCAAEDIMQVKVLGEEHLRNPYEREYDALLQRIRIGVDSESQRREFISDIEYKSDCGDAQAQCFLALRIYDQEKNSKLVFDLLKDASSAGDPQAELQLGWMYYRGIGIEKDVDAAERLYRSSALLGNPLALFYLGYCYMQGDCVRQDASKAIACFDHALKGGWIWAARGLAAIYGTGKVMPVDYVKANKYARMLADRGDNESRHILYNTYWHGYGVERDVGVALMWERLAAEDGYVPAQEVLAACYEWGNGVPMDRSEALRWYEKAAANGSPESMLHAAIYYSIGLGCEKNYGRAYYWAMTAVDLGYDEALWQVSHLFRNGYGVKQDLERADKYLIRALEKNTQAVWNPCKPETARSEYGTRLKWAGEDAAKVMKVHFWGVRSECPVDLSVASLKHGVELGSAEAMRCLGMSLQHGYFGLEKNPKQAFELYKKSSDLGDVSGMHHLGLAYFDGIGVQKDEVAAAKLIAEAAERGEVEAQYDYSRILSFGWGVARDRVKGIEWLRKSAEGGKLLAIGALGALMVSGDEVKKDVSQGIDLLERAASGGEVWAWRHLGMLFYTGEHVPLDYVRAYAYFCRGAEANDGDSYNNLSVLTEHGLGCVRDEKKAWTLLEKAIELGSEMALCRRGDLCREKGHLGSALEWYRRAANNGSARGKYLLALAYWRGEGVDQDVTKAVKLAEEAVRNGAEDTEGLVLPAKESDVGNVVETNKPDTFDDGVEHITIFRVLMYIAIGTVVMMVVKWLSF